MGPLRDFSHIVYATTLGFWLPWSMLKGPKMGRMIELNHITQLPTSIIPPTSRGYLRNIIVDQMDLKYSKMEFTKGFIYPISSWGDHLPYFQASNVIHQGIVGCTPTNVPLWEIPM